LTQDVLVLVSSVVVDPDKGTVMPLLLIVGKHECAINPRVGVRRVNG
jgi:hypothetical protein